MQVIDAGIGRAMKVAVGKEQDEWLEDAANLAQWENGTLTASERRILISNWVGKAWEKLCNEKADFIRRAFVKTGSGLTLSGEDDDKICPEGTVGYKFTVDGGAALAAAADAFPGPAAAEEKKEVDNDEEEEAEAGDADSEIGGLDHSDTEDSGIDEEERGLAKVVPATLQDVVADDLEVVAEQRAVDAALVGKMVAVKWCLAGWCVGTITKFYAKPRTKVQLNVEVSYEDEASGHRFRRAGDGDPKEGGHYAQGDDAPYGSWVLLRERQGD